MTHETMPAAPASARLLPVPVTEGTRADVAALPPPAIALSTIYRTEAGADVAEPRLRQTALPPDLVAEFEHLDRQMAWSDLSASTAQRYRAIVANYWSCCVATGRDRWSIGSVWDYLYALAYPRMLYLQLLAQGAPPDPRGHQPGIGRATVTLIAAAISKSFVTAGHHPLSAHPQWTSRMGGLLRRLRQPRDRKAPILREDLIAAVGRARSARSPLVQLRDAALLLLGWSCALRRSELVAVDLEHIQAQPTGWVLWVPTSKTDQHGRGRAIPLYPARTHDLDARLACQDWAAAAGIDRGCLFRPIDRLGRVRPER